MSIFSRLANSDGGYERTPWITEGLYETTLDVLKLGESKKNNGAPYAVAEFEVLSHKVEAEKVRHTPGSKVSRYFDMTKAPAIDELKRFLTVALPGLEEAIAKDVAEKVAAGTDVEDAKEQAWEALVLSLTGPENPLQGTRIDIQASDGTTGKGGDFTFCAYTYAGEQAAAA